MSENHLKARAQEILSSADVKIGGDRPWDIVVHNEGFYPRVLRQGSLGLGESYMDGWWDCRVISREKNPGVADCPFSHASAGRLAPSLRALCAGAQADTTRRVIVREPATAGSAQVVSGCRMTWVSRARPRHSGQANQATAGAARNLILSSKGYTNSRQEFPKEGKAVPSHPASPKSGP